MRRAIIFLLLLAQEAQNSLGELRSLEKKQEKSVVAQRSTPEHFPQIPHQWPGVLEEPKNIFDLRDMTGEIYIHKSIDRELYPILKVQFDVLDNKTIC
ncbi:hypothetical protein HF521_005950 [Silurus meridionalis]|uniref:Uncharacterized protein n=1 Tax=Silurus meridionalis TaxID=175797 RepID=A0A8T0AUS7_SILME|nr:hypothetical protein HF521_005950 [Silurus meridionalis]